MPPMASPAGPRRRPPWWALAASAAALAVLLWAALPAPAPEPSVLLGCWRREGEEYRLRVREVRPGGAAEVEYFNPRPIRVGEARTDTAGGRRTLRVVLRDENYPGSTYTLAYDPEGDRLTGEYYQAVHGITIPVVFLREK